MNNISETSAKTKVRAFVKWLGQQTAKKVSSSGTTTEYKCKNCGRKWTKRDPGRVVYLNDQAYLGLRVITATETLQATEAATMAGAEQKDKLIRVRFIRPSTLLLTFPDFAFGMPIENLGMPTDRIRWATAAASPAGNAMTVRGVKNDLITIDSGTLRYLVDPNYVATVDAALSDVRLSDAELERLSRNSQPPQEWYDQPEDLRLESWK